MSLIGAVSTLSGRGRSHTAGVGVSDEFLATIEATNIPGRPLVAHWRVNSSLEERIAARHASLGAGTEAYAAGLVHGSPGGSFDCAGVNWLTVPYHSAIKPSTGALMVYFRPASLHHGAVIGADGAGSNLGDFVIRTFETGTVRLRFVSPAASFVIDALGYYGVEQNICAIVNFSAAGFSLHLDGNLIGTEPEYTNGLANNTTDWRFGNVLDTPAVFNGRIDEIAIWSGGVLTQNEIWDLSLLEPPEVP